MRGQRGFRYGCIRIDKFRVDFNTASKYIPYTHINTGYTMTKPLLPNNGNNGMQVCKMIESICA